MRECFLILVALLVWPGNAAIAGVERIAGDAVDPREPVDPSQSAGLFVGVREFVYDRTLTNVQYAVDDAVDLAYLLSIERSPRLLEPSRVVLTLSGEPQKKESRERLSRLIASGAVRKDAGQAEILTALEEQAKTVTAKGILIVSFATHGVSRGGRQHLFAEDSILRHHGTLLDETAVHDVVSRGGVRRALILVDACRKRLTSDTRAGDADPRSAAAMLDALAAIHGIVVFSAAAAGDYAYDDDLQRNGVFTSAVMEGLRCKAGRDSRGYVTVDTLSDYVEERVLSWVQKNKDHEARRATQLQVEGKAGTMPLSHCAASQ